MKFKTRLVVAFFTIILIPLVLSSALVCMVGKYQLSSIDKNYGIKNTTVESLAMFCNRSYTADRTAIS